MKTNWKDDCKSQKLTSEDKWKQTKGCVCKSNAFVENEFRVDSDV